jgi:hypothetical protein
MVGMNMPDEREPQTTPRSFPTLPEKWYIAKIEVRRDRGWLYGGKDEHTYDALLEYQGDYEACGSGPDPISAVEAAIKQIKREPETDCRHGFKCVGWTVDPRTSTCWVCKKQFVFLSEPFDPSEWDVNP